jgi:hypothetical protein
MKRLYLNHLNETSELKNVKRHRFLYNQAAHHEDVSEVELQLHEFIISIIQFIFRLSYPVDKKMCAQSSTDALTEGAIPQCDKNRN